MSKKQWIGLSVAAVLFLFFAIIGVFFATSVNNTIADLSSMTLKNDLQSEDIALIYIVGAIEDVGDTISSRFSGGYRHSATINLIKSLSEDEANKGIMLYLNTPGGGVFESHEVYTELMKYKSQTERPVYAYMGNMATSGGYYISCAADLIFADVNCWTGSLGVVLSDVDYSGLYEKLGIREIVYASGPFKAGAPPELAEEEHAIYQALVDESYEQFVDIISEGRNMTTSEVKKLADGRIYSAKQALSNGLIDKIASFDEASEIIEEETGYAVNYASIDEESIVSWLFSKAEQVFPKSEAQVLLEVVQNDKSGRLWYIYNR